MKFLILVVENIRRNVVRTILTSLGTMMLVLVVTLVFTVLTTLDQVTTEKSANIKAIAFASLRLCLSASGNLRNVVPARLSNASQPTAFDHASRCLRSIPAVL